MRKTAMRSKKGFSRIELLIALLVIVVLIALLIPRFIRFVGRSTEKVCAANRATIQRLYRAHVLMQDDGCTLENVLRGECAGFEDDVRDYRCPGGGAYRADGDAQVLCSKHGG